MGKEQLEIKKESVGQYQEIDIKEEPCFTDVNNLLVAEKLQIKSEPIDNREQDLSFNQDETIVIKEEFSETFMKSEIFLDTSELCNVQIKNEDKGITKSISEDDNGNKFDCPFCKTIYSTKKSLKRHILAVHEGVKPYECTKCKAKFDSPCYLKAHITSAHESDRPYECVICKSKYKLQQVLNAHMKRVHKIENQQNRRKKQKDASNETEHAKKSEKKFQCPICLKNFKTESYIAKHILQVHEGNDIEDPLEIHQENNSIKCSKCEFTTTLKRLLTKHILEVHDEKNSLTCHSCNEIFARIKHLTTHIENVHDNQKFFQCFYCDRGYGNKKIWRKHIAKFHEKDIITPSYLLKHVASVHEEKKPFHCSMCPLKFAGKYYLKNHIEIVHEKKKPYKCTLCNSSYGKSYHLKIHIEEVHEGKKPNSCSFCDYSCARKSTLNVHIDSVHLGLKPYECAFCPQKFVSKGSLKRHLSSVHEGNHLAEVHEGKKINTQDANATLTEETSETFVKSGGKVLENVSSLSEKYFQCPICFKGFGVKSNLQRHIAIVHEI